MNGSSGILWRKWLLSRRLEEFSDNLSVWPVGFPQRSMVYHTHTKACIPGDCPPMDEYDYQSRIVGVRRVWENKLYSGSAFNDGPYTYEQAMEAIQSDVRWAGMGGRSIRAWLRG